MGVYRVQRTRHGHHFDLSMGRWVEPSSVHRICRPHFLLQCEQEGKALDQKDHHSPISIMLGQKRIRMLSRDWEEFPWWQKAGLNAC